MGFRVRGLGFVVWGFGLGAIPLGLQKKSGFYKGFDLSDP